MTTLHIENTVHDYASWQEAFDKFERFRTDNGVRSYRICQQVGAPEQVTVDLEFATTQEAAAFVPLLEQIWSTPQSREHLVSHSTPAMMEVVRERNLQPTAG